MRQIKFRAFDNKEMLYNIAVKDSLAFYNGESLTIKDGDIQYLIMQFTGFLDKNGTEIYEGDIISAISGRFIISFENGAFIRKCIFIIIRNNEKITNPLDPIHTLYETKGIESCEVIGNIYENPKLLKI